MLPTDPRFMYMILVLPSLFGITLIGDGIHKILNEEPSGVISIIFGLIFIIAVIFTFFFFSGYIGKGIITP